MDYVDTWPSHPYVPVKHPIAELVLHICSYNNFHSFWEVRLWSVAAEICAHLAWDAARIPIRPKMSSVVEGKAVNRSFEFEKL